MWRFTCEREDFRWTSAAAWTGPGGRGFLHDDRSFGLRRGDRLGAALHVELAAACARIGRLFPNILAAAAMLLIRRQKPKSSRAMPFAT